jgi:serine acetyltransferase
MKIIHYPQESTILGLKNRLLQSLAMALPGGGWLRVKLHRLRGVKLGRGVWIGYQVLIETAHPEEVTIGDRVIIGIRTTILAHFKDLTGVRIENDVYIGAGAMILPGVTIGAGAVVSAGSVVTASVPPMTVVQGNPAKRVATCRIPLGLRTPRLEYIRNLQRVNEKQASTSVGNENGATYEDWTNR